MLYIKQIYPNCEIPQLLMHNIYMWQIMYCNKTSHLQFVLEHYKFLQYFYINEQKMMKFWKNNFNKWKILCIFKIKLLKYSKIIKFTITTI